MKLIITKSLFKEFCQNPKLARRHKNDIKVYNKINQETYGAMDGALIGQEVENMVKKLRDPKDISIVSGYNTKDFHNTYHQSTQKSLDLDMPIIYQAGLLRDNLFVKCDFLKKNEEGTYDLIEVKAKNKIRKPNKDETLLDDLVADCSFQKYVLSKVLGDKFSGKVWIYHLDKEYIKDGEIVPSQIIAKEEVTEELATTDWIENTINSINKTIFLPKKEFEEWFPYQGENPLIYFGDSPKKGTIRNIPNFKTSKKKLTALYDLGKTKIDDLGPEEIELLASKDKSENNFQKYIRLYKEGTQFQKESIQEILAGLSFPLFFYDYETVSRPIPIFEKTHPRQQVVVQYSMHKMDADGTITHYEGLIAPGAKTNKDVIDKFIQDVGNPKGTFIVRNKGFENSRNDEIGKLYLEYREFFEQVNLQTFDLMDIFRDLAYFDPDFGGSCSIKKVLPVVSKITYDGMTVSNGGDASNYLHKLIENQLPIEISIENLLEYCKQDTRAMVEIYNFLKEKIEKEL
ncbi:MAG TPA: DUF2779 domain-containing protein [Candidatus Absconditabacterales bacterium]|nr:DUF2779 domain-containing protein [Candidatus Absconditabacterales bacterium]